MTGTRLGVDSDADLLMSTVAALMWAVVLWRTPTARRPGPGRTLWCALACLAVAQTLQVLIVYQTVDRALGAPGSAANTKHVLALASAACVRALVGQLAGERLGPVRRLGLPAGALLLMVAPYLLWPPHLLPAGLSGRAEFYGPALGVALPWMAFLSYLSWALGSAAVLCWRHRRYAASPALRHGLTMITLGTSAGFGFIALKVVLQVVWTVGDGSWLTGFDAGADAVILGASVTLCTLGANSEALADRTAAGVAMLQTAQSLRRLRPLWRQVFTAVPSIVLLPEPGWLAGLDPRSARLRLVRRVIEIRDGLMYLEPYLPSDARAVALRAAAAQGHIDVKAAATAEAGLLLAAARAKAAGASTGSDVRSAPPGAAGLAGEATWLELVSRELARTSSQQVADTVLAYARQDKQLAEGRA